MATQNIGSTGSNALTNMTGLSEAELQQRAQSLIDVKTGKINALSALDAALVDASLNTGKASMEAFTAAGSASIDVHAIDDPTSAFTNGKPFEGFASEPPAPPSIGGPQAALEKASKQGSKKMSGFCGCACEPCCPPPAPPPPQSPEHAAKPPPVPAQQDVVPVPPPAQAAQPSPQAPQAGAPTPRAPGQRATRSGFGLDGSGGPPTGAPATASTGPSGSDIAGAQSDIDGDSTNIQFELLKMQMQKMSQAQDALSNVISTMSDEGMTAIRNAKAS